MTQSRRMRRDARERREALINAAAECFTQSGYMVPLEVVAERAGVGRGTLYRNFPNRVALALAIFEREVERIEAGIDTVRPFYDVIARFVRDGARASNLFARLGHEMVGDGAHLDAFQNLGRRLERLLQPLVAAAQARGELRADLDGTHVVVAMRMASGLLSPWMTAAEVDAALERAMALLMAGMRPADKSR